MTGNLKDILSEEKMRVNKLKDDLDRESENVVRARTETEEIRSNLQQDIHDLQNKLHLAEITLATSRQQQQHQHVAPPPPPAQPVVETKPPIPPTAPTNTHIPYHIQPREQHVGMVSLPSMPVVGPQQMMAPQAAPYYAANAARRRLSLNKTADSITQVELDQVRSLEEEKYRLQRELQDTKGALDAYTTKLRGQTSDMTHHMVRERSNSVDFDGKCSKKHLRSQKLQLQKLIERLTHLGPAPPGY